MLKKICFILIVSMISACSSSKLITDEGGADSYNTDISEIGISTQKSFRVGMLLPLSGSDAKYGQGLKNASMLALNDVNNPNLVIQYYDTMSTPAGARIAIKNAVNQRAQLILGPLKSVEVSAISDETIYQGIPVIAFSTAPEVLQPTIYTLGLLVDEQVDRVLSYAASYGRKNLAMLLPDNAMGVSVARAGVKSAINNDMNVNIIAFYPAGTSDFSDLVLQMKQSGTAFDTILMPEGGVSLTAAAAMFAYNDIAYPEVQFLGTSIWETRVALKEATLQQSIYPSLSREYNNNFATQYAAIFGERPNSLYTLAYDAVILASHLSENPFDIKSEIIAPNGFNGLNGRVRFFEDGTNQHSLNIITINNQAEYIIDEGYKYFETINHTAAPIDVEKIYSTPQIFGKDPSLAQILIYGKAIDFVAPNSMDNDISEY